ncbi:MAG: hypothetical protein K9K88_02780 [Desulfobacterales bacterium]|nr:hypothetical protein [Desulfobacterales bacterium]
MKKFDPDFRGMPLENRLKTASTAGHDGFYLSISGHFVPLAHGGETIILRAGKMK